MPKKLIVVHPEGHEKAGQPTGEIQFQFEDSTVQTLNILALSPEIQFRLAIHGASQKGGDSYAGAKAEENPLAFAKASVKEVIDQLVANQWRSTREGGGPRISDLAVAFSRVANATIEAAMEYVGSLDEAATKDLRNKPKVKAALAQIKAEKAIAAAKRATEAADAAEKAEAEKVPA
jgi:hypothetical protein